jgi:hypothetical protein
MRDNTEIWTLINATIRKLRTDDCLGCMWNHGSQKHHDVCLTNINSHYYFKESIHYLFNNDLISLEEFNFWKVDKINFGCREF